MRKVLIVEDESLVALEIAETVGSYGFEVIGICAKGDDALGICETLHPNIILMDIRIKGKYDGIETARKIRGLYRPAIIFLTAFSDSEYIEKAVALQPLGYLIKPIDSKELYALLLMAASPLDAPLLGDLVLDDEFSFDTESSQLIRNSKFIKLTHRERQLMILLSRYPNSIISIYEIENAIWPDIPPNENTRRSLVSRLRAKLDNRFIETIPSEGYRLSL